MYLTPYSGLVFAHDANLIVAAGDRKHVTHLAPADLPEGHVVLELDNLFLLPSERLSLVRTILRGADPHFACTVFGTTGDHFVHQADIRAPCDVAYPVTMTTNGCFKRCLFTTKFPELDLVVITTCDQTLGRRLEFSISCAGALISEDGGLSGWTPANSINSSLMGDEILGLFPCVVLVFLKND